jgi:hypothetical protein
MSTLVLTSWRCLLAALLLLPLAGCGADWAAGVPPGGCGPATPCGDTGLWGTGNGGGQGGGGHGGGGHR